MSEKNLKSVFFWGATLFAFIVVLSFTAGAMTNAVAAHTLAGPAGTAVELSGASLALMPRAHSVGVGMGVTATGLTGLYYNGIALSCFLGVPGLLIVGGLVVAG